MSVYEEKTFKNGYVIVRMEYFNYKQFMDELEQFKKEYQVIGYHVNTVEGVATVKLFKKGNTDNE